MNKKGFTLVELLAVIAILAILVIIALPNVMGMFNEAKKNSFTTEVKEIYKTAQQQWISESMFKTSEKIYANTENDSCPNKLDLTGRKQLEYYIKIDKSGNVTKYYATDGTYQYGYNGEGLNIENITEVSQVSEINDSDVIRITCDSALIGGTTPSGDTGDDTTVVVAPGHDGTPGYPTTLPDTIYRYSISPSEIKIGNSLISINNTYSSPNGLISSGDYINDYFFNESVYYYLALGFQNSIVSDLNIGFKIGEDEYIIKYNPSVRTTYESNIQVLRTVFGASNCNKISEGQIREYFDCTIRGNSVRVSPNGHMAVLDYGHSKACYVDANTNSAASYARCGGLSDYGNPFSG